MPTQEELIIALRSLTAAAIVARDLFGEPYLQSIGAIDEALAVLAKCP